MKNLLKIRKQRALEKEQAIYRCWKKYGITIRNDAKRPDRLFNLSLDVETSTVKTSQINSYCLALEAAKDVINDFIYYRPYICWMI